MNKKAKYTKLLAAMMCTNFLYSCNNVSTAQINTAATVKTSIDSIAQTNTVTQLTASNQTTASTTIYKDISNDNSPIYVKNAGKTIISLQAGTENNLSDGKKYVTSSASTDEPNAAIFSKANLTINGTGKLIVRGNYNNGITCKDKLKIMGGSIQIYSTDDGLMGRDLVAVKDGKISIEAIGDGIKSTYDTDQRKDI